MYIERNHNKIYYDIYGSGEKKILLLHDLGRSSGSFAELLQKLQVKARVITVDLCGHGQSSVPKKTVSLKTMARDIIYLLEESYIGRCSVVGVGFGGAIALEAINFRPDLFGNVVFINTFTNSTIREIYNYKIRPVDDKEKDREFRDTFTKWIPALRDDFFIFAARFDGQGLLRYSERKMLFIYSDSSMQSTKDSFSLPAYSNIRLYLINTASRWLLDNYSDKLGRIIIKFQLEDKDDFDQLDVDENAYGLEEDRPDLGDLLLF